MKKELKNSFGSFGFLKGSFYEALPGILFFLGVLIVILVLNPGFFSRLPRTITSHMPLAFLAMAQIFVLTTGDIDLSAGAGLSLVNVMTVFVFMEYGVSSPALLLVPIGVGLMIGVINGVIVGFLRLNAFLATIGTTSIWTGLALLVMDRPGGSVPEWFSGAFSEGIVGLPISLWFMLLAIVIWLIFKFVPLSNHMYATGSDIESSFSTGIKANRMKFYAFVLNGLMIGLAGIVMTGNITSADPRIGEGLVLVSIIAALLGGGNFSGGSGNAFGAIGGALGLGLMNNLLFQLGISSFHRDVIYGSIVVLLVVVLSYSKWKGFKLGDIWGGSNEE